MASNPGRPRAIAQSVAGQQPGDGWPRRRGLPPLEPPGHRRTDRHRGVEVRARDVSHGVRHRQHGETEGARPRRNRCRAGRSGRPPRWARGRPLRRLRCHSRRTPARKSPRPRRRAALASREYACPISSTVRAGRRGPRWDHCPAVRRSAQQDARRRAVHAGARPGPGPPGCPACDPRPCRSARPGDGDGADAARSGRGLGVVTRPRNGATVVPSPNAKRARSGRSSRRSGDLTPKLRSEYLRTVAPETFRRKARLMVRVRTLRTQQRVKNRCQLPRPG